MMKKKVFGLILVLALLNSFGAYGAYGQKCVRGCKNWGFFAEFLWVINHLKWCEETNQTPVVYWDSQFAYFSKHGYNGSFNCWEYYFEPVSKLHCRPGDTINKKDVYNDFTSIWWYVQYIQNIELLTEKERESIKGVPLPFALVGDNQYYPSARGHLYSDSMRTTVKQLIDKYIVIKRPIRKKIDDFYSKNMKGKKVVGIHLRGGFIYNEVGEVPIEYICEEANNVADGDTIFFVATDQLPLLNRARELLKGEVVAYDIVRQSTTTSPVKPKQWPPKMGEDVLVETVLLSKCDFLVHTISNVSTAALYFNPQLPHLALYCDGGTKEL